jgi:outer membrane protein TolC
MSAKINTGKWRVLGRFVFSFLCLSSLLALLTSQSGCTRKFYRKAVDKEVTAILHDKDRYPFWKIEDFHVPPNPMSRFANPANPDNPPMPPDDPAAAFLAPNPQKPGKAGVARLENNAYLEIMGIWSAENRAQQQLSKKEKAENDREGFGLYQIPDQELMDQNGPDKEPATCPEPYLITLEQAVELGLINSREFQNHREDLYLTALPVTLQRFAFAPQFFFTEQAIRERFASKAPGGPANRWRFESSAGFAKIFSTGALLVAQLANETVVNLTGKAPHTVSISDINLDLVQPFLRGGGKAVTLEALTQVERNLVYEIRNYARFRKEFFVSIAGGDGLSSSGSFVGGFGGALSPGGGLGVPGLEISPGGAGRVILGTGLTANAQGYLPTLFIAAQLDNEKKNVAALEENFGLFQAFYEGGRIEKLQVDQVATDLLRSENNVLVRETQLRDALDQFKIQLGLPPTVPLELDDALIQPLRQHFEKYEQTFKLAKAVVLKADNTAAGLTEEFVNARNLEKVTGFAGGAIPMLQTAGLLKVKALEKVAAKAPLVRPYFGTLLTTDPAVQGTKFQKAIDSRLTALQSLSHTGLMKRLGELEAEVRILQLKREKLDLEKKAFPPSELARIASLSNDIDLANYELVLRIVQARPWERGIPIPDLAKGRELILQILQAGPPPAVFFPVEKDLLTQDKIFQLQFEVLDRSSGLVLFYFAKVISQAADERLDSLLNSWPEPPPLLVDGVNLLQDEQELALKIGIDHALSNRLDLMNSRAVVVDAWRQLAIFANSLLGVFNVRYHYDVSTGPTANQPLAFQGSTSRHQLFFNMELPLVRKAERNAYRASLIGFERARRVLMAVEDNIALTVRTEIRQLRLLAENYKIQKQVVHLAYPQVEVSREQLIKPEPQQNITSSGNAALTQQLLSRQASLLNAQNAMYQIWINYLIARLQLYRDLELMPLDPRGVWIDEAHQPTTPFPHAVPPDSGGIFHEPAQSEQLPPPEPVVPQARLGTPG